MADFLKIVDVDDKRHDFTLQGYLTLIWQDPRVQLIHGDETALLDLEETLKDLWLPDIWIKSLRDFSLHKSIKDQATIEMDANSRITYWQR